jgi:hypothetical protein
MGAGWVHGITDNPLTKLCEKYKLTLHDLGENLKMYDQDGAHVAKEVDSRVQQAFNVMLDQTKDDGIRVAVKAFDAAHAAKEEGVAMPEDSRDVKAMEVTAKEEKGAGEGAGQGAGEGLRAGADINGSDTASSDAGQGNSDGSEASKSVAGQASITLAENVTEEFKTLAAQWPIWESVWQPQDPPGSGKFHFDYSDNHQEHIFVIEGHAVLYPVDGSEAIVLTAGMQGVFHRGFKCNWHVLEPLRKYYCYYDEQMKPVEMNVDPPVIPDGFKSHFAANQV